MLSIDMSNPTSELDNYFTTRASTNDRLLLEEIKNRMNLRNNSEAFRWLVKDKAIELEII